MWSVGRAKIKCLRQGLGSDAGYLALLRQTTFRALANLSLLVRPRPTRLDVVELAFVALTIGGSSQGFLDNCSLRQFLVCKDRFEIQADIRPASQSVEYIQGGWRLADPLRMTHGMGQRGEVEQHGDASACGLNEAEGVVDW